MVSLRLCVRVCVCVCVCVCLCEGTINQVKGDTMSQCQLSCHVFPSDCEAG